MSVVFGIINNYQKKVSVDEIETFINAYSHIPSEYLETYKKDNSASSKKDFVVGYAYSTTKKLYMILG